MKALELLTPNDIMSLYVSSCQSFFFEQEGRFENLDGSPEMLKDDYDNYKGIPKDRKASIFFFDAIIDAMIFRNFINGYTNHKATLINDAHTCQEGCVIVDVPFDRCIIKDKKGNILKQHNCI